MDHSLAMLKIFNICFRPDVTKTASVLSLIVGSILALINHNNAIFSWAFTPQNVTQILVTYLVPYSVSTYSSVKAILAAEKV